MRFQNIIIVAVFVAVLIPGFYNPCSAIQCTSDYCKDVQCESITAEDCANRSPGRFRFEQYGGICGCCPFCLKVIGRNENCLMVVSEPRGLGTTIRAECEQGTQCNTQTMKCA